MTAPDQWRDTDEWLTVAAAAVRLGLSERQARRIVAALPEIDRSASGERPARVRWTALCPAGDANVRQDVRTDVRSIPPTGPETAPSGADRADIGADRRDNTPENAESMSGAGPAPASECPTETGDVRQDVRSAPDSQYAALAAALELLTGQLAVKDVQIADLRALLENEQRLRAMAQQPARALIEPPRRTWWSGLIGRWKARD